MQVSIHIKSSTVFWKDKQFDSSKKEYQDIVVFNS